MSYPVDDLPVVPRPSREFLNSTQLEEYREHRQEFLSWMLSMGKDPQHAEGYAFETTRNHAYRTDQFYRWVWGQEGYYTLKISHEHADRWLTDLAYSSHSNIHKNSSLKSVKILFRWRHHRNDDDLWEPIQKFRVTDNYPRDYLTLRERQKIRDASLEYGSIPGYNDLSPEDRDRWKAYLAQRFGKPKNEVIPRDWDRANGWKIPSLVWTSLDAGLRPVEVERAKVSWVDWQNGVLRIPKEESSKNEENWVVALHSQTTQYLQRWLRERLNYELYRSSDALWLTREGNPYQSYSLRYMLRRLCEIAGIDTENRKMSWYTLRHSTGTYMTREEDLKAAATQLRHKSTKTTMKYDQAPVEDRRNALERMG